jgi:hypothetical protein
LETSRHADVFVDRAISTLRWLLADSVLIHWTETIPDCGRVIPLPTFHIAHRTSQTQNPQPEIQKSHSTSPPTWKVLHLHQQADNSRCAWLLGIARPPLSAETAHEPLPVPRSPQRSTRAETHPASPTTPAKALAAEGGEVEEREKEKAKGSVRRRARGT